MLNFNVFASKTFWAAVAGAVGLVASEFSSTGHVSIPTIVQALALIVGAVGVRDAIAANGVGK